MFGFLKKKLREAADKITEVVSGKPEEVLEEQDIATEQIVEEPTPVIEESIEETPEHIEEPIIDQEELETTEDLEEISEKEDLKLPEDVQEEEIDQKEYVSEEPLPTETLPVEPKDDIKEEIKKEFLDQKLEIEEKQEIETQKPIETEKENEIPTQEEIKDPKEPEIDQEAEQQIMEKSLEEDIVEKEQIIEKEILKEPKTKKKGILERLGLKKKQEPEETQEEPSKEKKTDLVTSIKKAITETEVKESDINSILDELELSLLESDVAVEVSEKIMSDLKANLVGKSVKRGQLNKIVQDTLQKSVLEILDQPKINIEELAKTQKPLKIIFLGFNGTGKTTTIARLGHKLKEAGLSPVFAAGDTFRAAAIDQIEEHGQRLSIPVIKQKYGSDPAAVIFDAIKHAESKNIDIVLADTAGRSQANTNLMDELKKIIRVNKPDLKILVIDCLTGNDAVDQAKLFNEAVGVDALILTKADVYDKGGAVLSSTFAIKKPILYLGMGQEYDDLEEFDADKVAKNLFS